MAKAKAKPAQAVLQTLLGEICPSSEEQVKIRAMSHEEVRALCPAFHDFIDQALMPTPVGVVAP